ncbi:cytosolic factor, phosphatidylinositol/phosphatidylcholine transfer protein [Apophysomyces ossiformis]|uniref:Cytosolic factor, phosphatidylinositol/phosphatidylcholine transfer protein n=1 Tax=Apophysomyces ossiformis TaxID=679940 RepID=A0A8H7BM21_9FUNG|nr:cytosolic factor, phosphatidylinositol/phosphatidylcholine transfer protein [Apophysomyces ossiformis]
MPLFYMPGLRYVRTISELDDKYYPDCYNKLYIVNAPSSFVHVWKIVKAWVHPASIGKIHILGSNYKDTLLEQIPQENLPSFLGGSCTCEHMPGGCVPSHSKNSVTRPFTLNYVSLGLKNVPPLEPQQHNEQTPYPYNQDIMEKATKFANM